MKAVGTPITPVTTQFLIGNTGEHIGLNVGSLNPIHPSISMRTHLLCHFYRNSLKQVITTDEGSLNPKHHSAKTCYI